MLSRKGLIGAILGFALVMAIFALGAGVAGDPDAPHSMSIFQAAVLGVVEGLTEYLPVSSTGHLILTQRAMGIDDGETANAYAICIQLGAIVAVLGLYLGRVVQMGRGIVGRNPEGRKLFINILISFCPAAVIGLLFNDQIEASLYGLWPIVIAWFVGGMAILVISWMGKEKFPPSGLDVDHLNAVRAFAIGLMQCFAMWPGVSRSLVTIVGGVVLGLSLPAAVEYSFLLGVVTLFAATVYKGLSFGPEMLDAYGPMSMIVGFIGATVSAVFAVKWMVGYLGKHGLSIFGYYRVVLALIVAVMLWRQVL